MEVVERTEIMEDDEKNPEKWVEVVVVVQLCFFFVIMHVFYFCNIEKSVSKFYCQFN